MNSADHKTRRSRAPQARGQVRRQRLVTTAIELLDEKDLLEISLSDVAKRSGVPLGSIYYHFKSINALFGKVLVLFRDRLAGEIARPYELSASSEWHDLIALAIDRIVTMSNQHRAYIQVALNRHAPVEVRYDSGQKDGWEFVPIFADILGRHFQMPEIPGLDRVLLNFVDIIDILFVRSVEETGEIDELTRAEAKRAGIAYLRLYLPVHLPKQ